MPYYDKDKLKAALTLEDYFNLLTLFGGEPQYMPFGIVSSTICHNPPGVGSRKLYYYKNSNLFHCFTGCEDPSFDIYILVQKVMSIQKGRNLSWGEALQWVAGWKGYAPDVADQALGGFTEDWLVFQNYERINDITLNVPRKTLKAYPTDILYRFNYDVKIRPWLNDGINEEAMAFADIGYFAGQECITIPHWDVDDRFIGLRGRFLIREDAEQYGKYRPLKINGIWYTHPLGFNLYGLNWAKANIPKFKKVIVFEGEKSVLQYMSYFGTDNEIAVACCGSSISEHQFQLLMEQHPAEIVVAFDKDFEKIGDDVFAKQVKNCKRLNEKYGSYVRLSFLFDKTNSILPLKASPTDAGKDAFLKLFKERIIL